MNNKKDQSSNIEKALSTLERIGTIGSPSATTELSLDILGTAVEKKLVGELALFKFTQDGKNHYALGQITDVELRNVWLEDPTMRSLARHRGQVNPVSGQQDTHLGKMTLSAVFSDEGGRYEPSILGTVPQTGTYIHMATDEILDKLLEKFKREIFYLGHVYGSKPKLPLWFKHFDSGPNGAGEAYHLGIFGKTGSGKSVLAKMILLAYARYAQMAILIIDPQGEFAKDFRDKGTVGMFQLPIKDLTQSLGKPSYALSVRNLVLDRWELFEQILFESKFFDRLTMRYAVNKEPACNVLREELEKKKVKLSELYLRDSFDKAWTLLKEDKFQQKFLASKDARDRFNKAIMDANTDSFYNEHWLPITKLFRTDRNGARSIDKALSWLLKGNEASRPILIIDLSKEQAEGIFWNDKIQALVIKRLLSGLNQTAEYFYKEGQSLNSLVIIDEAHRLAPREAPTDDVEKSVRSVLIDAARTTRKYGLGWLFISQTLSSLHREILNQMRINFFGFGLSMGTEFQALREIAGGDSDSLKLYQTFRDPHSSFDTSSRQYSFMTVGPVSPLSFAGTPLFFTAFNTPEDFTKANNFKIK